MATSSSSSPAAAVGADFHSQADALFRKNLAIQRRAYKTNCCLVMFPLLVCGLLGLTQKAMDAFFEGAGGGVDCKGCAGSGVQRLRDDAVGGLSCPKECPLPKAPRWPVALRLPGGDDADPLAALSAAAAAEDDDAAKEEEKVAAAAPPGEGGLASPSDVLASLGTGTGKKQKLPPCVSPESCTAPAKFLVTGGNKSFAESLTSNMFPPHAAPNLTADISGLADFALATKGGGFGGGGYDSAFDGMEPLYFLQGKCAPNSTLSFPIQSGPDMSAKEARCTQGLFDWRKNSEAINDELYRGYIEDKVNTKRIENKNDIVSAYDLASSDLKSFSLTVQHNPDKSDFIWVARLTNLASNGYLKLRGGNTKMRFEFVKDMPRDGHPLKSLDISFIVGKLIFVWIIMLLFPWPDPGVTCPN